RRRWGDSCSTRFEGRSPQRFRFAVSRVTASGDHRFHGGVPASDDLSVEGTRRGRGASVLRTKSCGDVATVRNHRGKGPQGREACGPTGRATDEVRVGGEPQNRKVSRPYHSAFGAFACRRGDRVRRRDFIAGICGTAGTWASNLRILRAQERLAKIGLIVGLDQAAAGDFVRALPEGLSAA